MVIQVLQARIGDRQGELQGGQVAARRHEDPVDGVLQDLCFNVCRICCMV